MTILNLGCGAKTSAKRGVVNIDHSMLLRLKTSRLFAPLAPLLLSGARLEGFRALPDNIVVHDLARGIPFPDASVCAVYHSHMLEHLDRDTGEQFLAEVWRVLEPGGIHRIVVPDFEAACRAYVADIDASVVDPQRQAHHDSYIATILEQSVRRGAAGSASLAPVRRFLENLIVGDARRRGETHQWAYDRIVLGEKLRRAGYGKVISQTWSTSLIQDWTSYALDDNGLGEERKPGSLYVEAVKL